MSREPRSRPGEPRGAALRVLVVDDEPLARETLRDLLEADEEIAEVMECADGTEALRLLRESRPDIAFLDIEMPGLDGLEVASQLARDELPALVFVTAFGQFATHAFDVRAIDYLLKPYSDRRFSQALGRAKERVRERRLSELAGEIASLARGRSGRGEGDEAEDYLQKIAVKNRQRTLLVEVADIAWIESEDYYVRLHTKAGRHLVRNSLKSLEKRLDPRRFLRVHRSVLVNLDRVRELSSLIKGSAMLRLDDGTQLPVSRSRRRRVEEVLLRSAKTS